MKRPMSLMAGPSKFRIGLFGMNCSNGLCMTTAPERWEASWDNNVKAAQLADEAGLDFLLPIGRWHGYKGATDSQGSTFETITWAAGLLALTKRITISATLHVRFANPIFSAKQMVTADHIGKGRFALNIVSGWNQGEFDMFGVELIPHETRYHFTEEWVDIVKRVWSEDEPFDHDGQHYHLKDVLSKPKPWGRAFPLLYQCGCIHRGAPLCPAPRRLPLHVVQRYRQSDRKRARSPGNITRIWPRSRRFRQRSHHLPSDPQRGRRVLSLHRRRTR